MYHKQVKMLWNEHFWIKWYIPSLSVIGYWKAFRDIIMFGFEKPSEASITGISPRNLLNTLWDLESLNLQEISSVTKFWIVEKLEILSGRLP